MFGKTAGRALVRGKRGGKRARGGQKRRQDLHRDLDGDDIPGLVLGARVDDAEVDADQGADARSEHDALACCSKNLGVEPDSRWRDSQQARGEHGGDADLALRRELQLRHRADGEHQQEDVDAEADGGERDGESVGLCALDRDPVLLPRLAAARGGEDELADGDGAVKGCLEGGTGIDGAAEPAHGPEDFKVEEEEGELDEDELHEGGLEGRC